MVVRLVRLECFLHFLYILELAVAAWNILEFIAYQPYILQTGCLQLIYNLLVLLLPVSLLMASLALPMVEKLNMAICGSAIPATD